MVKDGLRDGVEIAAKAVGGPAALARALRITSQAVSQWERIPASRIVEIAKITGVPRHLLRPDLYDMPAQRVSA